jgi:hypothetical protein
MADKPTKKKDAAVRVWLDETGNALETADYAQVRGIRYIHVPSSKRVKADYDPAKDAPIKGCYFDQMFGDNVGSMQLAAFGGLTLAGNIASQVTNENNPKGDSNANPIPAISDRFADIFDGIWSDREGTGGGRFNAESLITALLQVKQMPDNDANRQRVAAKLQTRVDGKSGADAASDAKGSITWGAFTLKNPTIRAAYDKINGTAETSLDQIVI